MWQVYTSYCKQNNDLTYFYIPLCIVYYCWLFDTLFQSSSISVFTFKFVQDIHCSNNKFHTMIAAVIIGWSIGITKHKCISKIIFSCHVHTCTPTTHTVSIYYCSSVFAIFPWKPWSSDRNWDVAFWSILSCVDSNWKIVLSVLQSQNFIFLYKSKSNCNNYWNLEFKRKSVASFHTIYTHVVFDIPFFLL